MLFSKYWVFLLMWFLQILFYFVFWLGNIKLWRTSLILSQGASYINIYLIYWSIRQSNTLSMWYQKGHVEEVHCKITNIFSAWSHIKISTINYPFSVSLQRHFWELSRKFLYNPQYPLYNSWLWFGADPSTIPWCYLFWLACKPTFLLLFSWSRVEELQRRCYIQNQQM